MVKYVLKVLIKKKQILKVVKACEYLKVFHFMDQNFLNSSINFVYVYKVH